MLFRSGELRETGSRDEREKICKVRIRGLLERRRSSRILAESDEGLRVPRSLRTSGCCAGSRYWMNGERIYFLLKWHESSLRLQSIRPRSAASGEDPAREDVRLENCSVQACEAESI